MRRKEGLFVMAQVVVVVAILLLISLPVASQPPTGASSTTSTDTETVDTTTAPCNAPGVYCGPGFAISNASLLSAATLGRNYSVLNFTANGTYSTIRFTTLSIWLADTNFSQYSFPNGGNGPHLVVRINPTWSGKSGSSYVFDVPMTGFNAINGARCELWIDAFSALGPLKGDNWAMQNMTIG